MYTPRLCQWALPVNPLTRTLYRSHDVLAAIFESRSQPGHRGCDPTISPSQPRCRGCDAPVRIAAMPRWLRYRHRGHDL